MTKKINLAELESQRKEFAAAYRQASEQLRAAQGMVKTKTLETALWGWRWARAVNDLHGMPPGKGHWSRPGAISTDQAIAYCVELGLSTKLTKNGDAGGQPGGLTTINRLRKVAACVATEDHLRELIAEYGSISLVSDSLRPAGEGKTAEQMREKEQERGRDRYAARPPTGYMKFVPPQDWTSYLVEQGMSRGEISAALCLSLDELGPEESFKIWDRAGRPNRYRDPSGVDKTPTSRAGIGRSRSNRPTA